MSARHARCVGTFIFQFLTFLLDPWMSLGPLDNTFIAENLKMKNAGLHTPRLTCRGHRFPFANASETKNGRSETSCATCRHLHFPFLESSMVRWLVWPSFRAAPIFSSPTSPIPSSCSTSHTYSPVMTAYPSRLHILFISSLHLRIDG